MGVPGCPNKQDGADRQSHRPFNVSSRRFATPASPISSNPGPGLYASDDKYAWQHGSFGHKGFGSLATSQRLSCRVTYTGPGPASYSPKMSSKCYTAPHHALKIGGTSSNAKCSSRFTSKILSSTPAPGTYGIPGVTHSGSVVDWCSIRKPGAAAAFRATSRQQTPSAIKPPPLPELQQQVMCQQTLVLGGISSSSTKLSSVQRVRDALPHHQGGKLAGPDPTAARTAVASAQLAHRITAAVLGRQRCVSAPSLRGVFDAAASAAPNVPGVDRCACVLAVRPFRCSTEQQKGSCLPVCHMMPSL